MKQGYFKQQMKVIFMMIMLGSQVINLYAGGGDCRYMVTRENKLERPIPSARVYEYEECVRSLDASKSDDRSILLSSYNKLISYYDSIDNQTKVEEYRNKLQVLQK